MDEETKRKISNALKGKRNSLGYRHTKETKARMSATRTGHITTEETKEKIRESNLGKTRSEETRRRISAAKIGKKNPLIAGEKSNFWKGGISPENRRLRSSLEYRLWRKSVFERDRWTCIWCGYKGTHIEADHIKRWADFPELRFAIDNGRTLCKPCHRTTDTWGNRK